MRTRAAQVNTPDTRINAVGSRSSRHSLLHAESPMKKPRYYAAWEKQHDYRGHEPPPADAADVTNGELT